MKKRNVLSALFMAFLIFGCAAPAVPPQLAVENPATTFSTLTATPRILPTATENEKRIKATELAILPVSTPTPELSLKTNGPYFAYFREMNGKYQFVMMDADGVGRKAIDLPQGMVDSFPNKEHDLDMSLISPDGHWLAFYAGSAGDYTELPAQGIADLTLNLMDLTTGDIQVIAPLLSKVYPNNFDEAAKKLNDPYTTAESLRVAFLNGITQAYAWSPDGRYLAFAGQMDGLSSDLYAYDMKTKAIRRLSSGEQELQWIDWSPDGKWVLNGSTLWVGEGITFDVNAVGADGTSTHYLSNNSLYSGPENWLNANEYFEHDSQNGPGDYALRLVDIDTGKTTKIWDGSYFSYAIDTNKKLVLVNAMLPDISPDLYSGNDPNFRRGPYLVDLTNLKKTKIGFPSNEIFIDYAASPFDLMEQIFILIGNNSESYFLSNKLELSSLDLNNAKILISTDQTFWIAVASNAIKVYSADNTLMKSISLPFSDVNRCDPTWMQNSLGLFLVCGSNIYSVILSTEKINSIESNRIDAFLGPRYMWISGQ